MQEVAEIQTSDLNLQSVLSFPVAFLVKKPFLISASTSFGVLLDFPHLLFSL